MANWRPSEGDQAAGLRQLLTRPVQRSISLIGGRGRIGKTSLVINLATALTERGHRVLILDEFTGSGNAAGRLGLFPRFTLKEVLRGERPLEDLLLEVNPDLAVLPLPSDAALFAGLDDQAEARLTQQFSQLTADVDFLLVDARALTAAQQPSLALATDTRLIVLADRAEAITDAYTFIKLLSRDFAKHDFWLLVNRVPDLKAARALFERVSLVARRFTRAELRLLGFVPEDPQLHRANHLLQSVLQAFPDAESTHACRQLAEALERLTPTANTTPDAFVHRLIESSRAFAVGQPH